MQCFTKEAYLTYLSPYFRQKLGAGNPTPALAFGGVCFKLGYLSLFHHLNKAFLLEWKGPAMALLRLRNLRFANTFYKEKQDRGVRTLQCLS